MCHKIALLWAKPINYESQDGANKAVWDEDTVAPVIAFVDLGLLNDLITKSENNQCIFMLQKSGIFL